MKKKPINIVSWNVNGIRALHEKGFLQWLTERKDIDILCLQETKASEEQIPMDIRSLKDYESHFVSAQRKGYSGVGLFTRVKPVSVKGGFGEPRFDSEGRVLIAQFEDFTLFNIYFPNGKQSGERLKYKLDFYDAFLEYANEIKRHGMPIIVCGDFNTAHNEIDLARPKENQKVSGFLPEERAWIDKLISSGYVDAFRVFNKEPGNYSWWDLKTGARQRNVGWRIDYFFVSEDLESSLESAKISAEVKGSDHCPVEITLTLQKAKA